MSPATRDVVMLGPGRLEPPGMKMVGMSIRAAAFRWAGMDLSQLDVRIMPSQGTAEAWTSTMLASASREASTTFMPSWPWAQPSQMSVA